MKAPRRQKWRLAIGWTLALAVLGLNQTPIMRELRELPDKIYLQQQDSLDLGIGSPFQVTADKDGRLDVSQDVTTGHKVFSNAADTESEGPIQSRLRVSWMGIPLKTIDVQVLQAQSLIPGGSSIGVALQTQGTLVVGRASIIDESGKTCNPGVEAGIQPGDIITHVDGIEVENANHLTELIDARMPNAVSLTLKRSDKTMDVTVTPVREQQDGRYRMGLWVRDSTAGVGTMTFYDPQTQKFAALGHSISDLDTGNLLTVRSGDVYESKVIDVQQGQNGTPGEMHGQFGSAQSKFGTLESNTPYGIFGTCSREVVNPLYTEPIPIGGRDVIHTGKASILTTVDDGGVKEYECEIVRLYKQSEPQVKSMVLKITDQELLQKTGGIVQGMSGSPILQDGRLVGAVTHVFVNDPTMGHGVYIEWMLQACN